MPDSERTHRIRTGCLCLAILRGILFQDVRLYAAEPERITDQGAWDRVPVLVSNQIALTDGQVATFGFWVSRERLLATGAWNGRSTDIPLGIEQAITIARQASPADGRKLTLAQAELRRVPMPTLEELKRIGGISSTSPRFEKPYEWAWVWRVAFDDDWHPETQQVSRDHVDAVMGGPESKFEHIILMDGSIVEPCQGILDFGEEQLAMLMPDEIKAEREALEQLEPYLRNAHQRERDGWQRVESLSLTEDADDSVFELMSRFTRLNHLTASGSKVTGTGLYHLKDLKLLSDLQFGSSAITDEGLEALTEISAVGSLYLAKTNITDAGIAHLAKLPDLRSLTLTETSVGDAGLEALIDCPKLTSIGLVGTKVTDDGVLKLKDMPQLRGLYFSLGTVSARAVNQLREDLPEASITLAPR